MPRPPAGHRSVSALVSSPAVQEVHQRQKEGVRKSALHLATLPAFQQRLVIGRTLRPYSCFLVDVERRLEHLPREQWWDKDAPTFLPGHLISHVTGTTRVELRVRLLNWLGDHGDVVHLVILAIVRKFFFRESQFENIDGLVVSRPTLFERHAGGTEQPAMRRR